MAFPVSGGYSTTPAYSGSFIPTLWSKKLLVKYYTDNQLAEIVNTDYEGEIKNQGDTIRIRMAPTLSINDYTVGMTLAYEIPTPNYIEMTIDKGKYFAFQCNDVIEAQSDLSLLDMYTEDAAKQLKISIADDVYFNTFIGATNAATSNKLAHPANHGATAGVRSGALNLGTDASPIDVTTTPGNLLNVILRMSAVLDEQNVPESGRWLLLTPYDRQILMQSGLAQAYFTGDDASIIRTGKIGMIDRFTVYVSNLLPRGAAAKAWVSGMTDPSTGATYTGVSARRMVIAGTKDAISFATQFTKTETLRNPNDFGDVVRSLQVYGRKTVKPEALTIAVIK